MKFVKKLSQLNVLVEEPYSHLTAFIRALKILIELV